MRQAGILLIGMIFVITGQVFAQQAAVEIGQGDYVLDNICAGKAGESVERSFYDSAQAQLNMKAYCKDGQFNGVVKKYNPAGKIRVKAQYTLGQLNGTVKLHDNGGTLLFRDEYKNGSKTGRYKYNEQGQLIQVP